MILLLVCFFISISAVSASENIDIEHSVYNSSIDSFSENAEILESKVKTIEELDNEIQNSQPESTIKLKNDYIISNETTIDGIDIYTNITIDGQGHTIDGSSSDMDYLFRIYEDNVVLKNIRFINLESIYSYNSIEWLGDNGKMVNCTFINNYAYDGGCIDWTGSDGQIINCEFINNTAENGGAIYYYGNYGTISNCTFINNFASEGGAICIVGRNNRIDRCSFDSNTADDGGAIYWDNIYGNLTNSTFTDNCAENGGAIYTSSFKSNVISCDFYNNTADDTAGAIYWSANEGNILYCTFKDNNASIAGAVYGATNDEIMINNSAFINNLAKTLGGALLVEDEGFIENTEFLNNSANIGGAVYCSSESHIINSTFTRNSAEIGGALVITDGEITNSIFTNNHASDSGGARVLVQNPKDNDETQFLKTTSHSNVQINNLSIEGFNIAIENNGKLKIMNSHLNNNRVDYNSKSDYRGAIVNAGLLSVLNTTFANNYAKYGGSVYNTGASKFVMCNFTNNQGYSDKKNIDIYNKEGSVEYITTNTKNPNMFEKHPMSQWKQDLIKSSIKLATLIVTATTGWGIAASEISCAAVLSTTINAIIGGAFGALDGFIYSNDHQDYGKFWASVIEGVGNGMDFTDFGEAIHELRPLLDSEMVKAGLSQIYVQFRSKTVEFAKSLSEEHEHESNFDDIDVYAFFNS